MSAIQKAILKACDIDGPEKGESRGDFLLRCIRAINKLADDDYNALPKAVLDWFNKAADEVEANKKADKKKALPDFPDLEEEQPAATTSRRRRAADDEDDNASVVAVGKTVTLVTKRGKEHKGVVIEKDDKVIVLKVKDEELEFDMDKVGTIEVFNDGKAGDEPAGPVEPTVGCDVEFVTKRGRKASGKVIEIDDEVLVVKTEDGEEEFNRGRIESIKVLGGKAAKKEEKAPEETGRRRSSEAAEPEEKGGRASSKANGGVSVGQRIKELIVDNLDASKEEIGKLLAKDKLEYRPNTLDLAYSEAHKVISILKDRKLLKG